MSSLEEKNSLVSDLSMKLLALAPELIELRAQSKMEILALQNNCNQAAAAVLEMEGKLSTLQQQYVVCQNQLIDSSFDP